MGAVNVLRALLVALAVACLAACGAHDVAEEEAAETFSEEALTNCDPGTSELVLEIRSGGGLGNTAYRDVDLVEPAVQLRAGELVRHDPRDIRMKSTRALRNDALLVKRRGGAEFWVPMAAVRMKPPEGGVCASGARPAEHASPALRIASADDSLPLALARGTVACGLGLGEGVVDGATELLRFVGQLMALAPAAAREIFELDRDIFYAALGRADAAERLRARVSSARAMAESIAATVMHAIPAIQAALKDGYAYYRMLDAEGQSKMLCSVIGRLSFEVVIGLGLSFVAKEAAVMFTRVAVAHAEATRKAAIAGRAGGLVSLKVLASVAREREVAARFGEGWAAAVKAEREVQARWLMKFDDDLKIVLDPNASAEARLTAMDRISEASNPPNRIAGPGSAYPTHNGNCAFAAFTLLATVATGSPQCALPYLDDAHFSRGMFAELAAWKMAEPTFGTASDVARAAEALAEGEVAILFSRAWQGEKELSAHATMLVRLEGRIYNVNNQGWTPHESLEAWTQRWSARGYSRVAFGISSGSARLGAGTP